MLRRGNKELEMQGLSEYLSSIQRDFSEVIWVPTGTDRYLLGCSEERKV